MKSKVFLLTLFLALAAIEGAVALFRLFEERSMEKNAVLFGFSLMRLAIGAATMLLILFFAFLSIRTIVSKNQSEQFILAMDQWFQTPGRVFAAVVALLYLVFWIAFVFLSINSPLSLHLGMIVVIFNRMKFTFIWICLLAFQAIILLGIYYPHLLRFPGPSESNQWLETKKAVLAITAVFTIISAIMTAIFRTRIFLFISILFIIAVAVQIIHVWLIQYQLYAKWYRTAIVVLNAITLFCVVVIVYRLTTMYVNMLATPDKSYFDHLAEAWLNGRLYLTNLGSNHDLTFFNGNWYVANPPLVAILMLPYVALFGRAALNTVVFSILFSALNATLIFVLLEKMTDRGWVQLSRTSCVWLTLFFAFGTAHWYLGVVGKMWMLSKITTVTFLAIATLLAVWRKPVFYQGVALGLAMLARPNILTIAPVLLGIAVQNARDDSKSFRYKDLLLWGVKIGIPIIVAGVSLLYYNWLRFGNIFDYGYLTENVADFMAQDLKDYGTFHPHFILRNLQVMFLYLPKWSTYCSSYLPSVQGMSMFIVSPALLYLAGSLRRKPWILGAWGGIVATLIPLALYYNTGAWQFGYKYLLDFIVPVIMLLAVPAGNRMPWLMRLLILVSIVMNAYGVLWWFGVTVCRG